MKTGIGIAALVGLAILVALIVHHSVSDIMGLLRTAGLGLLGVALFHWVPLACSAFGWMALRHDREHAGIIWYLLVRWIREGVNGLLPVAQVGGPVVAARLLAQRGVRASLAGASVVGDVGAEFITQALFTIIGLGFLLLGGHYGGELHWLIIGSLYLVASAVGFFYAQRVGLFRLVERFLDRLADRFPVLSMGDVKGLHDAVVEIHNNHRALATCAFWHFMSWVTGIGEVWLALYVLGHPVDWQTALVLESLGQAVRGAAFMIPGGLGVQEAGFVLLGSLYGLTAEVSIALSLCKRVRELVMGLPALATWQTMELRRMLGRNDRSRSADIN